MNEWMEFTLVLAGILLCLLLLHLVRRLRQLKRTFHRHCHGQYAGPNTITTTTGPFCYGRVAGRPELTPLWPREDEAELGQPEPNQETDR